MDKGFFHKLYKNNIKFQLKKHIAELNIVQLSDLTTEFQRSKNEAMTQL